MISPLLQAEIWRDRVNQLLDRCRDGFPEGLLVERHGFALDGIHTLFSTSSPTLRSLKWTNRITLPAIQHKWEAKINSKNLN